MNKLLILATVGLLLIGSIFYIYYEQEEPAQIINNNQEYQPKEIIYAPLDCMINESFYDVKCYEDSLDGN